MTRQDEDSYRRGRSPFRPPARRPLLPGWSGVRAAARLRRRHAPAGPAGRGHRRRPGPARGHGLRGAGRADRRHRPLHPAPARVAYTVVGASRQLIIGPEGSIAAMVAAAVVPLAADGVAVVGDVPAGPPAVKLPDADLGDGLALLPAALGIFLVSYSGEILTARSFAGRRGEHIRANTELGAMGAANLAAGFTQGFPIGASGARTAVNDQMGVRSQLSGLLAAGVIALVLLFLTAPMEHRPKAALGAVIVAAGIGIVNPGAWRGLARTSRVEVAIAAITMAGVILVLVLEALLEAGIVELVGGDHLYPTVRAAVQAAAAPAPGSPSEGDGRPPSETGR